MPHTQVEPQYVDTAERLTSLVAAIERSDVAVIDTEFIPEDTFEPRLCLIQIATSEGIGIVDPLSVGELGPLWRSLTEPTRELVTLGGRQEILFCMRGAGRAPVRFVDLQIVAGLVGHGYPLSQTRLLQRVVGVHVKGGEAFTDWMRRPLSARQLGYAADDVRYLLSARDRLMQEAQAKGRVAWIEAECRRMVDRVVASEAEEAWRRVSGSSGLDPRESAIVRELWKWRDQVGRSCNRPAKRILPDHLVVAIARRKPSRIDDLTMLRGTDRGSIRKSGGEILAAVERGIALPESECPPNMRRVDPPQVGILAQFLAAVTQTLAAQHHLEPTLLATSSDLQELVRWRMGLDGAALPWILEGWRAEILQPLLDILDGKRQVRIANLASKNPIALIDPSGP